MVAAEYQEAVEAVIEGFRDEQARVEEQKRSLAALKMWRRFLISLRIKEQVDGYEIEGEEPDIGPQQDEDDSGMDTEEYVDDGGGGFLID